MCSQRSAEWTRRRSGRGRRARRIGAEGSGAGRGASSSLLTTAVLDTRPPDLFVSRKVRGDWLRAEREVLLHELIAAVLARRLDHDAIVALVDGVAAVVAPIPRPRVSARQARRARHRGDEVGTARAHLLALAAEPASQLAEVARSATGRVHPQTECAHVPARRALHPHGHVRAVVADALLRRDLEVDGELEAVVPLRRGSALPCEALEASEPGEGECDAGEPPEHVAAAELRIVTHIVHRSIPLK